MLNNFSKAIFDFFIHCREKSKDKNNLIKFLELPLKKYINYFLELHMRNNLEDEIIFYSLKIQQELSKIVQIDDKNGCFVFIISWIIAQKFYSDFPVSNSSISKKLCIPIQHINSGEIQILQILDWKITDTI